MHPLLLCVHMESAKLMRVSFAAMALGIQVKEVRKDQWGQTVGALCGLDQENPKAPTGTIKEEMLIMAFFPNNLMDAFLKELRSSGCAVRLKAVLTSHNRAWPLSFLYQQLLAEAASFQK